MNSLALWAIRSGEIIQAGICLACLATSARTLSDARRTRKRILSTGENHGADAYSRAMVRDKGAILAAQLFSTAAAAIGVALAFRRPIAFSLPFETANLLRTAMSVTLAWCAIQNTRAFRKLRDGK